MTNYAKIPFPPWLAFLLIAVILIHVLFGTGQKENNNLHPLSARFRARRARQTELPHFIQHPLPVAAGDIRFFSETKTSFNVVGGWIDLRHAESCRLCSAPHALSPCPLQEPTSAGHPSTSYEQLPTYDFSVAEARVLFVPASNLAENSSVLIAPSECPTAVHVVINTPSQTLDNDIIPRNQDFQSAQFDEPIPTFLLATI